MDLLLHGWQSYNETTGASIPAATPGYNTTNNIALNSFTRTVARSKHGEGVQRTWPPRSGEQVLL